MAEFVINNLIPLLLFEVLMLVIAFVDSGRVYRNLLIKEPEWMDSRRKGVAIVASLIAFCPLPFLFGLGNESDGYFGFCWLIAIPIWLCIYYLWSIGGVKNAN